MNDLDCCLIVIKEKKLKKDPNQSQMLDLPFNEFKMNFYNYTARNKKLELKAFVKAPLNNRNERQRPDDSYKNQGLNQFTFVHKIYDKKDGSADTFAYKMG